MDKVIHCDCGFEARAADEEALVAKIRRHAWEAHQMALTPDEALLLAFRAELESDTSGGSSSFDNAREPKEKS